MRATASHTSDQTSSSARLASTTRQRVGSAVNQRMVRLAHSAVKFERPPDPDD